MMKKTIFVLFFWVLLCIFFPIIQNIVASETLFLHLEPGYWGIHVEQSNFTLVMKADSVGQNISKMQGEVFIPGFFDLNSVQIGSFFSVKDAKITFRFSKKTNIVYFDLQNTDKNKKSIYGKEAILLLFHCKAMQSGNGYFQIRSLQIEDFDNNTISFKSTPLAVKIQKKKNIEILLKIGDKIAFRNRKEIKLEQAPFILQNRTMVPIRFVSESMGASVLWDSKNQYILIRVEELDIIFKLYQYNVVLNGRIEYVDVPPILVKNRVFVPVGFIGQTLGGIIEWDPKKQSIRILF